MATSSSHAQNLAADGGNQTFDYLSSQYFDSILFKFAPTEGTAAGLHQYDSQLEDYSAAGVQREVSAGDKDETLVVKVPIKPATLLIQGPVDKTYQIVEHPELAVRAGMNTVPLKSAFEPITVKQIDSNVTVPVRLEAGKSVPATF